MLQPIRAYVRFVDKLNTIVGKFAMLLVFVMMGILLCESISRTFFNAPHIWTMESAQYTMAAYYMLGGGFSMLLRAHVRMDVLYGRWFTRTRARVDRFTIFCMIFYLIVLLYGGISSTAYSLEYGQHSRTAWAPPLAPVKIIMCIGIVLMLLQAIATFFKDLAKARGEEL